MMKLHSNKGLTLIELLVVISIIVILTSFAVPQIGNAREKARKAKCLNNLRVIGSACIMYADEHQGSFPAKLADLYPTYVGDHAVFGCPSGGAVTVSGDVPSGDGYLSRAGVKDSTSGNVIAAMCNGHHDNGTNVLFATGGVRWLDSGEIGTGDGQYDDDGVDVAIDG